MTFLEIERGKKEIEKSKKKEGKREKEKVKSLIPHFFVILFILPYSYFERKNCETNMADFTTRSFFFKDL